MPPATMSHRRSVHLGTSVQAVGLVCHQRPARREPMIVGTPRPLALPSASIMLASSVDSAGVLALVARPRYGPAMASNEMLEVPCITSLVNCSEKDVQAIVRSPERVQLRKVTPEKMCVWPVSYHMMEETPPAL